MLKQLLMGMACCWSSAVFGQYYRDVIVVDEQQHAVRAATLKNRRTGEVYISSAEGRVRVFGEPADSVEIRHIAFAPRLLRWSDLPPTLVLTEFVYSLPEIDIAYDEARTYQVVNRFLQQVRRKERVLNRNFAYNLETVYRDTLLEKSDGWVAADLSSVGGFQRQQMATGRYAFREEAPFLNLHFSQFLQFFKMFDSEPEALLRSPLNNRKIRKNNTRINELACPECGRNTLLFQLKPSGGSYAEATLALDTARMQPQRLTLRSSQERQRFFQAIVPEHDLQRADFEVTYYFDATGYITSVQLEMTLDYDRKTAVYRDLQMRLTYWQINPHTDLRQVFAGKVTLNNDLEHIAVASVFPDLLNRTVHRLDVADNQRKYRRLAADEVVDDNQITLNLLNAMSQSAVKIWSDSFLQYPIQFTNNDPVRDARAYELLRSHLEFGWYFLLEDSVGRLRVRSAPTFVNLQQSYFTNTSQARALLYCNLLLDFCEVQRHILLDSLQTCRTAAEAQRLVNSFYQYTVRQVERLHEQSDNGRSLERLRPLNELIFSSLGKNNFQALVRLANTELVQSSPYSYADLLALSGDYKGAVEEYNLALGSAAVPRAVVLANRLECLLQLKRFDEACADYHTLLKMGQQVRRPERLAACKQE